MLFSAISNTMKVRVHQSKSETQYRAYEFYSKAKHKYQDSVFVDFKFNFVSN